MARRRLRRVSACSSSTTLIPLHCEALCVLNDLHYPQMIPWNLSVTACCCRLVCLPNSKLSGRASFSSIAWVVRWRAARGQCSEAFDQSNKATWPALMPRLQEVERLCSCVSFTNHQCALLQGAPTVQHPRLREGDEAAGRHFAATISRGFQ
eukprot:1740972-Amphidinium_carterae.1